MEHRLNPSLENVHWGFFDAKLPPRLTVDPGDTVVVDTPAAIYGSDAAVIAARCGAALVIARQGRSRLSELQDLVATLSEGPARLAGVVMNEF